MAITLKRQLTDDEKDQVLRQHGRHCFATGHEIPEGETIHFDHIRAFSADGPTTLANIAPMCAQHNLEKGTLALEDFRIKLRLQGFFSTGDKLTLKSLLEYLQKEEAIPEFGLPVTVREDGGFVTVESARGRNSYPLLTCPTTRWKYFYATLGVEVLDSDDDQDHSLGLQPRYLISDKVFDLFRHFQFHPVLQQSIGRLVTNRIRLFDGQHKVAALLWNGRREFECKVYLSPEVRLLNQTNIAAHDRFAQTRFYSSIMVLKLGSQFGVDFDAYKNLDDGHPKTEAGFIGFLLNQEIGRATKGELKARFRSYLYNSILENDENKLSRLVSASNRSTDEKPLTIDLLSKSLFACFLYREPTEDNMATEMYRRDAEVVNMVRLMNMLDELALSNWNPKATFQDQGQLRLTRLVRSKSMMAWSEILRDAVCAKLEIYDEDEKAKVLYRDLREDQLARIKEVLARLVAWKHWGAPPYDEIDRVLADNKSEVKERLRQKGLTTGYLMGAPE